MTTHNIHAPYMRSFLTLILLSMLFSPALLHAQEIHYVGPEYAAAKTTTKIKALPNGKYSLYHDGKLRFENADSIVHHKYEAYNILKDGKRGVYSEEGKQIVPVIYDHTEWYHYYYIIVEKDGLKGLYTRNGERIFNAAYDEIQILGYRLQGGERFYVKIKGKWGVCNEQGKYIVEPIYDKVRGSGTIVYLTRNNETDYLFDYKHLVTGLTITNDYICIANGKNDTTRSYFVFKKDNLYGLLDEDGKVIIPATYSSINCKTIKYSTEKIQWLIVSEGDKYGIIDMHRNIILPIQYKSIERTSTIGYMVVEDDSCKRFYNCRDNAFVNAYTFDDYYVMDKYTRIKNGNMRTLIDNSTMKMVFPFKYEYIIPDDKTGYFCVQKNGLYGFVDADDKVVIPLIYEKPMRISFGDKIIICKEGEYGIINLKNELLYGMIPYSIEAHRDYFEIRDYENDYPRLDSNLKLIKDK